MKIISDLKLEELPNLLGGNSVIFQLHTAQKFQPCLTNLTLFPFKDKKDEVK